MNNYSSIKSTAVDLMLKLSMSNIRIHETHRLTIDD